MFLLDPQLLVGDIFITILLAFGIAISIYCIQFLYNKKTSRFTKFSIGFLALISFIATISLGYATWVEPNRITVIEHKIYTNKLPPMRLAIISDIHTRPGKAEIFLERIVAVTNSTNPDLVLLPGDFVFNHTSDPAPLATFANLQSSYGAYAVLGNHDQGKYKQLGGEQYTTSANIQAIVAALASGNVHLLRNEAKTITIGSQFLTIAGIDDLWANPDLTSAIAGMQEEDATILLSHNPSIIQDSNSDIIDLIVSGHTHGGQVRFPFIGSIKSLPTTLGKQFGRGIFPLELNRWLAITSGVGESLMRVRFLTPPEIMILTIEEEPAL